MSLHKLLSSYFSVRACFTYTAHPASLNLKLGTFFKGVFSPFYICKEETNIMCVSDAEGGIRISICLIFLPQCSTTPLRLTLGEEKEEWSFRIRLKENWSFLGSGERSVLTPDSDFGYCFTEQHPFKENRQTPDKAIKTVLLFQREIKDMLLSIPVSVSVSLLSSGQTSRTRAGLSSVTPVLNHFQQKRTDSEVQTHVSVYPCHRNLLD